MQYHEILDRLKSYVVPGGIPSNIFLLPESGMRGIYDCITSNGFTATLELGSGFGATTCVMAAAVQATGGSVTSIDLAANPAANARLLAAHSGIGPELNLIIDPLGYNWYLADLIRKQTVDGVCKPLFDFCLLDGAHEWQPDALALYLAVKLLKPGGIIALDDLNFNMRMCENWQVSHSHLSERELDEFQIAMVWELVAKQHPDLHGFRVTDNDRIGWAQKRRTPKPQAVKKKRLLARLFEA